MSLLITYNVGGINNVIFYQFILKYFVINLDQYAAKAD